MDVAVWDYNQLFPELVLFGSVEAQVCYKVLPTVWKYPQFAGQMVAQAALNYRVGRTQPDGSVR